VKIEVCGKGGSGKSTVVALLAQEIRRHSYEVLVVDSDESNTGLYKMLGFEDSPVSLMEMLGGKTSLKGKMAEPNIFKENEISLANMPKENIGRKDGLRFVIIGKILQSLEGCACPMGVLSREFLNKLRLDGNQIAIVDMEAGVEHFGRGVETSIDIIIIVVEPSMESVNVAERIYRFASGLGIKNIWGVLNKIPSEAVASKLQVELEKRRIETVGCIHFDSDVSSFGMEGTLPPQGKARSDAKAVSGRIMLAKKKYKL